VPFVEREVGAGDATRWATVALFRAVCDTVAAETSAAGSVKATNLRTTKLPFVEPEVLATRLCDTAITLLPAVRFSIAASSEGAIGPAKPLRTIGERTAFRQRLGRITAIAGLVIRRVNDSIAAYLVRQAVRATAISADAVTVVTCLPGTDHPVATTSRYTYPQVTEPVRNTTGRATLRLRGSATPTNLLTANASIDRVAAFLPGGTHPAITTHADL